MIAINFDFLSYEENEYDYEISDWHFSMSDGVIEFC